MKELLIATAALLFLLAIAHVIIGNQYKRNDLDYSDETSIFNDDEE